MDMLTSLSGLPDACCKELFSRKMKLSKTYCHLHLVFSHKMFSQQGLCLAASDLNLCTHLSSCIYGKTASSSRKYATLFKLSSSYRNR